MLLLPLTVVQLGRVPLAAALTWQEEMTARLQAGHGDDLLALAEHPPVYTVGACAGAAARQSAPAEMIDGVPLTAVVRSGGLYYQGPGQLTGYFLRTLPLLPGGAPDVAGHLRGLHAALVQACAALGVAVVARDGQAGVWAAKPTWRQVALVGVHVRGGIARFGFVLNVAPDLAVASVGALGGPVDLAVVAAAVVAEISRTFGYMHEDQHWVMREEAMHRKSSSDGSI